MEAHRSTVQLERLQAEPPEPAARLEGTRRSQGLRRDALNRRLLGLSDALSAGLALALSAFLTNNYGFHAETLVLMPVAVLASKIIGLYDRDDVLIVRSTVDELPALFQLATAYTFAIWLLEPLFGLAESIARAQIIVLWCAFFLLSVLGRLAVRRLVLATSAPERCLVIGSETSQLRVGSKLAQHVAKVEVVGVLEAAALADRDPLSHLEALIGQLDVDRVIVVPDESHPEAMLELIRSAKGLGVKISILPRILEVVGSSVVIDHLGGIPLLGVRQFGLSSSSRLIKRGFDVVVAGTALVLASPLMLTIAVAIRCTSRGPVFFRQVRVGRDGEPFSIFKFRTMVADAEDRKADLHAINEADGLFKIADDPRTTRVGRWLRRSSLDELPQLLNVLRGEMSIVGPRPLIVSEDEKITGFDRRRLNLTPGMTGHWQILGSARVPLEEMVKIDYLYVAGWTLWADVKLMVRTVPFVLGRRGL